MGYRSDVSLMVRTEDLENFKKNNFEQYKLAFLKDIEGNTEELQCRELGLLRDACSR